MRPPISNQKGQSFVEAIIVMGMAPVLLTMFFAINYFGQAYSETIKLPNATRYAAVRYGREGTFFVPQTILNTTDSQISGGAQKGTSGSLAFQGGILSVWFLLTPLFSSSFYSATYFPQDIAGLLFPWAVTAGTTFSQVGQNLLPSSSNPIFAFFLNLLRGLFSGFNSVVNNGQPWAKGMSIVTVEASLPPTFGMNFSATIQDSCAVDQGTWYSSGNGNPGLGNNYFSFFIAYTIQGLIDGAFFPI